jgi:hypothetical protein
MPGNKFQRDPRKTSRGWNPKDGEYATISIPNRKDVGLIVLHFLTFIRQYPKAKLPDELKRTAEITLSENRQSTLVRIRLNTQDTRATAVIDEAVKQLLVLSRKT